MENKIGVRKFGRGGGEEASDLLGEMGGRWRSWGLKMEFDGLWETGRQMRKNRIRKTAESKGVWR